MCQDDNLNMFSFLSWHNNTKNVLQISVAVIGKKQKNRLNIFPNNKLNYCIIYDWEVEEYQHLINILFKDGIQFQE